MHFLPIILSAAALISAAPEQKPQGQHLRALIVTGEDYPGHVWKETAPAVRRLLEKDPRFEARIVEDPEFLASPILADYDVIVLHFKNYKPLWRAAEAHENLVKLVKGGKGLVALHFACGAFQDWPEYANLVGRVWNPKAVPQHDPRGPFMVHVTQPQHPITRGLHDFQADDELYTCLVGDRPVEILATAQSKSTGKDYPMAFVFEYGRGRVFHTPLGHDRRALEMPGVGELIRRGCAWAAGAAP
jgi:type 1 glutamine amidotransferase